MKSTTACGWVLRAPGPQVLVLRSRAHNEWGLPKGHVEPGESERETALRELTEETGLSEAEINADTNYRDLIQYQVTLANGDPVQKTAVYFRANLSETPDIQLSKEHTEFRWITQQEVNDLIVHDDLSHLIHRALDT